MSALRAEDQSKYQRNRLISSFPRKRESTEAVPQRSPWTRAFAGVTMTVCETCFKSSNFSRGVDGICYCPHRVGTVRQRADERPVDRLVGGLARLNLRPLRFHDLSLDNAADLDPSDRKNLAFATLAGERGLGLTASAHGHSVELTKRAFGFEFRH